MERKFYTPDDALITGIKAILAEEYSRELMRASFWDSSSVLQRL